MADTTDIADAFTLWQQFMERIEYDPWLCSADGTKFCLFCGRTPFVHEPDCIFLAVWDMLTRTTATQAPSYG